MCIYNDVKVTFTSDGLENLSPFNLGAGNSYLAKILIMGLSCKKGHILIIENPEIHLHPKAQAKLADFFVLLENMGIQVIVETHSEHFINKLRYNVYKKKLKSDDIVIYYKPSIQGDFEKISINSNGHFIDDEKSEIVFPSGFFDSTLSELLEIM
jgi:predicted ATPase